MFDSRRDPNAAPSPPIDRKPLAIDAQHGTAVALRVGVGGGSLVFQREGIVVHVTLSPEKVRLVRGALSGDPSPESTEIEGKWLVASAESFERALPMNEARRIEISQGYVVIDESGSEVRVRRKQEGDDVSHLLTLKHRGGLIRGEAEFPLSTEAYDALSKHFVHGRSVIKTRWAVPFLTPEGQSITLEYDRYRKVGPESAPEGHYLPNSTVEVEFGTREEYQRFCAGGKADGMGQDITDEKGFKNQSLAVRGFPR